MREGSLHMKARLTRLSSTWLSVLILFVAAPVWATQPPTAARVASVPNDGARAPVVDTRLAWDRVGAPLKDLS